MKGCSTGFCRAKAAGRLLTVVVLAGALLAPIACTARSFPAYPELTLRRIWLEDLPGGGQAIACELDVSNPNFAPLQIGGFEHSLVLNGDFVARGADNIPLRLPARGSAEQVVYLYSFNTLVQQRLIHLFTAGRQANFRLTTKYYPGGPSAPLPSEILTEGVTALAYAASLPTSERLAGASEAPCQVGVSRDGKQVMYTTSGTGSTCVFP